MLNANSPALLHVHMYALHMYTCTHYTCTHYACTHAVACGEYISVAGQRDTEEADIEKERQMQVGTIFTIF